MTNISRGSVTRQKEIGEIARLGLQELEKKDLLWKIRTLQGPSVPRTVVDGKDVLMLCSSNYLGLSDHPKVKRAAIEAIEKYGAGSGSVRVIAGTMEIHVELEEELARYKRTEAGLVYQSGFTANCGTIPQLVDEGDLIISDELNHNSIVEGCRLSRAEKKLYQHRDTGVLRHILEDAGERYRRILIITDGVFSMDGDVAPLPEIVKLGKKHGAIVYVDDAHGDGVLGEDGRGSISHYGLEGQVDVDMGTFSKAFGVVGGYVAGKKELKEYLQNRVRPFLFTGSHPPPVAAACLAAIRVVQEEPEIVKRLWDNTRKFKKGLKEMGFDIGQSETPITPVMVGSSTKTKRMADELFSMGVFVVPIVFPMVHEGKARIRTIMSAAHTQEDLNFALDHFGKAGKKFGIV